MYHSSRLSQPPSCQGKSSIVRTILRSFRTILFRIQDWRREVVGAPAIVFRR